MAGKMERLRADISADARCANGSFELPAATIDFIEYANTKVVAIRFQFSYTKDAGSLTGSVFRFFYGGYVECMNWNRDEECWVQGRENGYMFDTPDIDPDSVESFNELEHFIDSVCAFAKDCVAGSGIALEDRIHV